MRSRRLFGSALRVEDGPALGAGGGACGHAADSGIEPLKPRSFLGATIVTMKHTVLFRYHSSYFCEFLLVIGGEAMNLESLPLPQKTVDSLNLIKSFLTNDPANKNWLAILRLVGIVSERAMNPLIPGDRLSVPPPTQRIS